MKTLAVFVSIVALSLASDLAQWRSFKLTHGKVYSNVLEETTRYATFQKNIQKINEHNSNYDAGLVTWKMGVNKFADMSEEEFKAFLPKWDVEAMKEAQAKSVNVTTFKLAPEVSVPSSIDWRTMGAVTGVKDQGSCGGCWAFSATGTLEGQYYRKYGNLLSFSEQNLIDCVTTNDGCGGGVIQWSYDYIQQNGIEVESDYPYTGVDGSCKYQSRLSKTSVKGYTNIDYNNENQLYQAVGTVGPVSVAVNADGLQFYSSGIYSDTSCSTEVNHGVLAVGYNSENGVNYWIIKNSWGTAFGENGYVRMLRGYDLCGIALWSSYPSV